MARQQQLDLPHGAKPPPSTARQALEAAFSSPPTVPASPPAEVVVKRKRTLIASNETSLAPVDTVLQVEAAGPNVEHEASERAPRVFRVDTPVQVSPTVVQAMAGPGLSSDPSAVPSESGDGAEQTLDIASVPVVPVRRPRRRTAPAVITSFEVPCEAEVATEHVDDADARPARRDAEKLPQRLAALEPTFSMVRDAKEFRLVSRKEKVRGKPAKASYLALLVEIERLKLEAEVARKAEAAEAIRWIKKQIATYDLTANDLDL